MWRQASLIGGALLAAAIWLAEVHGHGWHGLTWLSYFHWAIPIGWLLLLAWLWSWSDFLAFRRRLVLIAIVAGIMPVWFLLVEEALRFQFAGRGMILYLIDFDALGFGQIAATWLLWLCRWLVVPLAIATPLLGTWILTRCGCRPEPWRVLVACVCYLGAVPFGIEVLAMFGFERFADPIHTFKTGVVILPLFYGLGILLPTAAARPVATDDPDDR